MAYDPVQAICDQLIAIIEDCIATGKTLPWHKPWKPGKVTLTSETVSVETSADWPYNATSGRSYSGINIWILLASPYPTQGWGTYKQWHKVAESHLSQSGYVWNAEIRQYEHPDGDAAPFGADPAPGVKRGETATTVCFWKFLKGTSKDENGNVVKDENGKPIVKTIPMLRTYSVFNIAQCDGINADRLPAVTPRTVTIRRPDPSSVVPGLPDALREAEPLAHAMLHAYLTQHTALSLANVAGDRACYNSLSDRIEMPHIEQFDSPAQYAGTLLHEAVHSTGHSSRLNRDLRNRFGDQAYAFEELVAEFGTASLCALANVPSRMREDHAPYLLSWTRKIMDHDKYAPHSAVKLAREATEMIAGKEAVSSGSYGTNEEE